MYLVLREGIQYCCYDDVVGARVCLCLQFVLTHHLVPELHGMLTGHLGMKKILEKVKCKFYWEGQ